jgi:hypothetical protein
MKGKYTTLKNLSRILGLPKPYLKKQAECGNIPFLIVNGYYRFDVEAVKAALAELAAQGGGND